MDNEKRCRARQDAIACTELTKGLTYDASTAHGRALMSINKLSNYIIEMTEDVEEEAFQRTLNGI